MLVGCGGHRRSVSPETVVRAWSVALNKGDNEAAAALFATDAEVIQGPLDVRLHTRRIAVAFNESLPCAGVISDLVRDGDVVTATFVLGQRPGVACDGPGQRATATFTVRNGKIVVWRQLPAPGGGTSV